ncbi:MAG: GNAT family N-acetyltransferase, partial [Terriglobales bacterium]
PGEAGVVAMRALARHLGRQRAWDLIELRDMPAGGAAEALVEEAAALGHATGRWLAMESPYIDLTSAPAVPGLSPGLHATSKKFRAKLAAYRRQLEAGGETVKLVRARWRDEPELRAQLAEFYRFEAAGWKGRQGSSVLARPGARAFYDLAGVAMAREGWLVLHRLELGAHRGTRAAGALGPAPTKVLAMGYGLAHRGCFYALKWAYDEAHAHARPGQLLVQTMLVEDEDTANPVRRFDFTGSDAPYKQKWTKTRHPHSYLYIFRRGWRGAGLHSLKFVWTPRLQRWARRMAAGGSPLHAPTPRCGLGNEETCRQAAP